MTTSEVILLSIVITALGVSVWSLFSSIKSYRNILKTAKEIEEIIDETKTYSEK